jgi:hypothetical protein
MARGFKALLLLAELMTAYGLNGTIGAPQGANKTTGDAKQIRGIDGIYYLINVNYQKYLAAHSDDGVVVWAGSDIHDHGPAPQDLQWSLQLVPGETDIYYLINQNYNKYLAAHSDNSVVVWKGADIHDHGPQPDDLRFKLGQVPSVEDTFYFFNQHYTNYLAAHSDNSVMVWRGTDIHDHGPAPEDLQWTLQMVSGSLGEILV